MSATNMTFGHEPLRLTKDSSHVRFGTTTDDTVRVWCKRCYGWVDCGSGDGAYGLLGEIAAFIRVHQHCEDDR